MASSLSDVLSTIQNGVIALNNLAAQIKGSFTNILSRFVTDETNIATNTTNIATNTASIATLVAGPLTAGNVATQADQETATSTSLAVTPGRQQFHPSAPKAWAYVTQAAGAYTLSSSYNIASINKTGVGVVQVNLTTAMSSALYAAIVTTSGGSSIVQANTAIGSSSQVTVTIIRSSTEGLTDSGFAIVFFGDQ